MALGIVASSTGCGGGRMARPAAAPPWPRLLPRPGCGATAREGREAAKAAATAKQGESRTERAQVRLVELLDRNALLLRTAAKYNIEARLAHNSYMSTSPQGTSDGARPTTSTTTAPIAIPTAAANKQRYGQHQSTSLRAAEQQSQARVSVSLSVSAPMGDALAFSTAATAASPTASASPASSPPDELHLDTTS